MAVSAYDRVFLDFNDQVGLDLPAIGGDQVTVVLHGCNPVVHQVLIDIVLFNQRFVRVMGQQVFGELSNDGLRWQPRLQTFECFGALLPPAGKQGIHTVDEADELRMSVDGGLDGLLGNGQVKVAGAIDFEQGLPKLWTHLSIRLQGIHVGAGYAAL